MGTKGGKPLSTIEKRQARVDKKEEKKPLIKEERKETKLPIVDQSLVRKVAEDVKSQPFITTFSIVQKYGVRYGVAKRILKALESQKLVNTVLKTRRITIVIPNKAS